MLLTLLHAAMSALSTEIVVPTCLAESNSLAAKDYTEVLLAKHITMGRQVCTSFCCTFFCIKQSNFFDYLINSHYSK